MHEKVKAYFDQKQAETQQQESAAQRAQHKAREALLIQEGLYEKVYMQEGDDPNEFDCFDRSGDTERRYKRVMIDVTDEEFERIQRLSKIASPNSATWNLNWDPVLILRIGAVLFLLVALLSLLSGEGALFPSLYTFFSAVTLGFAELIAVLKK